MHITNILGVIQGIVAALQAAPEKYTTVLPAKWHTAFHTLLGVMSVAIWLVQRDYNRVGEKTQ